MGKAITYKVSELFSLFFTVCEDVFYIFMKNYFNIV